MIEHYFHTGSANPEWYNSLRNIDDLDPDGDYVSGLRPRLIDLECADLIESHKRLEKGE